jgi:hypothetical protein
MAGPRPSHPALNRKLPDDGRWFPSPAMAAVALALGVGVPVVWLMTDPGPSPAPAAPRATAPVPAPVAPDAVARPAVAPPMNPAAQPGMPQIPRQRDPNGDQTPDIADYINAGEVPTMSDVIARLHAAGVHSGLGAFSPPGTRPPLVGLAVPKDFPLPAGYVRHHQTTDDGQPIEPILMFAPDAQWLDAQGRPVPLPADRVVPPEMAPPGLPIRRIVVPAPASPGK